MDSETTGCKHEHIHGHLSAIIHVSYYEDPNVKGDYLGRVQKDEIDYSASHFECEDCGKVIEGSFMAAHSMRDR